MKLISDRTEIAKAMNFGKYPVVTVNIEDHGGFDTTSYCIGCDCRVAYTSKRYGEMYTRGHVK